MHPGSTPGFLTSCRNPAVCVFVVKQVQYFFNWFFPPFAHVPAHFVFVRCRTFYLGDGLKRTWAQFRGLIGLVWGVNSRSKFEIWV